MHNHVYMHYRVHYFVTLHVRAVVHSTNEREIPSSTIMIHLATKSRPLDQVDVVVMELDIGKESRATLHASHPPSIPKKNNLFARSALLLRHRSLCWTHGHCACLACICTLHLRLHCMHASMRVHARRATNSFSSAAWPCYAYVAAGVPLHACMHACMHAM